MSYTTTHLIPNELLQRITAGAAERDAKRDLPFALIQELKASGFGHQRLSGTYGGEGATLVHMFSAAFQLAEADPNVAHIWRNHHVVMERLLNTPSQHPLLNKLRARVIAGDMIGQANTEINHPQIGGNVPFFSRLVKNNGKYELNGKKFYSTGALYSDWIYAPVSLEDDRRVIVILPKNRKGIETIDDWTGMGQRLTGSGTTIFEHVHVDSDEILFPEDIPQQQGQFGSTIAQLYLTSIVAGIVSAITRDAAELLGKRHRNFYYAPDSAGARDPLLLAAMGEQQAAAFAVHAIVQAAAAVADKAYIALIAQDSQAGDFLQDAAAAAAKAKITVDRIAQHTASALFDIAGASATLAHHNLDRHWRNIRTLSSHNPITHKAYALGNLSINGVPLPTQGFF
ncbi:acyl-CoA dehydrogenase family protein [Advenella mimigardefordensis]|uniref:Putative acyl-CoA dehydrogenase n=1 Tax=Advenella mimigardefordensis (strain DSM 17166 / LMG 22922 / DPN7) TaxID=1247726 RepID=W0PIA3_ADVMD|nr:acyl-CoA dehydrogenase family protein [Advenella mimigardefordensis]AHG65557.1 putative acyl-CoA dehydrogenase [Advenella mimigardefordensis DPN7]